MNTKGQGTIRTWNRLRRLRLAWKLESLALYRIDQGDRDG